MPLPHPELAIPEILSDRVEVDGHRQLGGRRPLLVPVAFWLAATLKDKDQIRSDGNVHSVNLVYIDVL